MDPVVLYQAWVDTLKDPNASGENKLKAVQEMSAVDFEAVVKSPKYPEFLQNALGLFLKVLQEETHFIAEHSIKQRRKHILEIIHRIPSNKHLLPHVKTILSMMFKLLKVENEENALICLRIIIELHKTARPEFSIEIQDFLLFVKEIYKELPKHCDKIFKHQSTIVVKNLANVNVKNIVWESFATTTIHLEKKSDDKSGEKDDTVVQYNLLPRALRSLKVLAELPIIVVLMYQLYKLNVSQDVAEFIPLIMDTISLQPTEEQRASPNFNREVFVDFLAAQIKTLSFLAYIVGIYQEEVKRHSDRLARGMMGLLRLCPQEVAHLRKELLIAARHILATDLRENFVDCLEELFDDNVLIGSGWTANESLRPLAYSTLADLVHHVRKSLPLKDLARAVTVFSKNVHDESLLTTIQAMSCRLLLNLVECIREKSEEENGNGRELLMRLLEVFVLKFKTIAKLQLPVLMEKCRQQQQQQLQSFASLQQASQAQSASSISSAVITVPQPVPSPSGATTHSSVKTPSSEVRAEQKSDPKATQLQYSGLVDGKEEKPKFGFPTSQAANYTVSECRNLVKTLGCGVSAITRGIIACKSPEANDSSKPNTQIEQFKPKETLVFIRLMKYAFQALDVYTISIPVPGQSHARAHTFQAVRSKDEKEILENIAGVFNMINPLTFKEMFSTSIEYMVNRIHQNCALQIIASLFLSNTSTSSIFATILVEYLLERMEEMGSDMERSNLYLKLFKLVFGSVSIYPVQNEQMLRPYLHQIVNRSIELALSAKEPYNYFLLLRALFRSIGGGSHDPLYQEFLPLLPNLLQGLNSLQSGLHKQHMKDLFVELCLTVPVRLSSLLPYLPMLMDPLVSALNGSQTLVKQGLRTLELCVDNLQPDYLYDHIQPVRAELMQALWRTLRNPSDDIAQAAFRVLGKFGGGNRKMMSEPQKLEYMSQESIGPCITVQFPDHKNSISLPVGKIIESAFNALKCSATSSFYRKQCWSVIKGYLAANIEQDNEAHLLKFFSHKGFSSGEIKPVLQPLYKCPDSEARKVHEMALSGMFVAAAIKELGPEVRPFMVDLVRHYTALMVSQECGIYVGSGRQVKFQGMDPLVLIDATAAIMGHEEKELWKPGSLALLVIINTAGTYLASETSASQLPFYEYLSAKMCSLCYERAWYAKHGGCIAIKSLMKCLPSKWVFAHLFRFLRALLFVMLDLTAEVSSGAIDMAKGNMERMLKDFGMPIVPNGENDDLIEAQNRALIEVVQELTRQITSPNTCVREQAMHSLQLLATVSGKTVTAVVEPHKELLVDMIPPRKHRLHHQPVNSQIGLLDGNTFCITLMPSLFTIDLNNKEHGVFFQDLITLCESSDTTIQKYPCYKLVNNLVPLRKSALRVLAACYHIEHKITDIFLLLYSALQSPHKELQETAFECLQQMNANCNLDMERVHLEIRPVLSKMQGYQFLTLAAMQQLSYLTQLFPKSFNEHLCDQLLAHLHSSLQAAVGIAIAMRDSGNSKTKETTAGNDVKIACSIINIFHQIPAATDKLIKPLLNCIWNAEKALMLEAGSPFREPAVKFLQLSRNGIVASTIEFLLTNECIQNDHASRFLEYLLKGSKGTPFRKVVQENPKRLKEMVAFVLSQSPSPVVHSIQYKAIRIVSLLVKHDDKWLSGQPELVDNLLKVWISSDFQSRHLKSDSMDYMQWKEPKLITRCLLNYSKHQPENIELLFQLLRAFTGRFIPDFEFLRDFLENTVAKSYPVEWKRRAFFLFVKHLPDVAYPQDLKAKIMQYILIPSFAFSFEKREVCELITGEPAPQEGVPPVDPESSAENDIVTVFIKKVISTDDAVKQCPTSDALRILLLQFSCLLVERASAHIQDASNKRQGVRLKGLTTFAWPCLLTKNCVDPAAKYHGYLLLANIIAKFSIPAKMVLQVFHGLLKAHAAEARTVVRQALEVLTPAMPMQMRDGNDMLTHWTKKIIVEEGHTLAQLVHLLQLLVRHYNVYYSVRHRLIHHMVSSVQRLMLTPNATIEHKKLAVDLAEVIIIWEVRTVNEARASSESKGLSTLKTEPSEPMQSTSTGVARPNITESPKVKKSRSSSDPDRSRPVEKVHADAIVNFLLRMACQVNETSTAAGSSGELLSRRCVTLLKTALKPDIWPNADLNLAWFEKLLSTIGNPQPNYSSICTALELLAFLLTILKKETILSAFHLLQKGIDLSLKCQHSKVIRSVHNLLSRLMNIFPTEPANSNIASKYPELESLYKEINKIVSEGLQSYEKSATSSPAALFGTLMILKAACMNNPCYIDRLILFFMRALQKMTRDHLSAAPNEANSTNTDLLILSLDLVKNRVGVMGQDMRKTFIGTILVGLIEKSPDVKVLKEITKMVEDWVKSKSPIAVNQSPTIREKSILLVKMMQYIEKRFPNELELNAQFLYLVHYVYKDERLKSTDLQSKLEPAFMAGLRCVQPHVRAKFFEVFDASMNRKVVERLLYICCSQNWETAGPHYWIRHCIELILITALSDTRIKGDNPNVLLPAITSVINLEESRGRINLDAIEEEPLDVDSVKSKDEDDIDIEMINKDSVQGRAVTANSRIKMRAMLLKQIEILKKLQDETTINFLNATAQLCHMDTSLAEHIWIQLFPRIWKILSEKQQNALSMEIVPFIASGSHVIQKDCHPSAMGTYTEAVSQCVPPIYIRPLVLSYLGKSHNLWYRSCLLLEQIAFERGLGPQAKSRVMLEPLEGDGSVSCQIEALDKMAHMYSKLGEEDLWSGLWMKRAKCPTTGTAVALEQQGLFIQAQNFYEQIIQKCAQERVASYPISMRSENSLWPDHWAKCTRELNQWDSLIEYGNLPASPNPMIVLENAWKEPNWNLVKDALEKMEQNCPTEFAWKVSLYKGYLNICNPEDRHLNVVEKLVEVAAALCIREWRRLPHIVSHIHIPLLQGAQQVIELQDAAQIHQGLLPANIHRENSLFDMKAVLKTWKNRVPVLSDNLSHWSDIFAWRQLHYQTIVSSESGSGAQHDNQSNHAMLGNHASAQSIIHFGKIARKQGLPTVCLEALGKIHAMRTVPVVDCFQKIRQQVKCYLQIAQSTCKSNVPESIAALKDGLKIINSTSMQFFPKEMIAELTAMKGLFLMKMGNLDEAHKNFSAATQLHDCLVKAWARWGDYMEYIFTKEKPETRNIMSGVAALVCFLHACRHQNESNSRKCLPKVFWLLTYDDDQLQLAIAVEKHSVGVPPIQWLPWIPQLLTCLGRREGVLLLNIVSHVGRVFPQAVYFPIRTLYLISKIEQRERCELGKVAQSTAADSQRGHGSQSLGSAGSSMPLLTETTQSPSAGSSTSPRQSMEPGSIKASPTMMRYTKIMHIQRDVHPTVLASLEGIVDQMVWFRENVYEEVLRQLRQALAKCYVIAYEKAGAVSEAGVSPHTFNFVKKLVSTFGVGIENASNIQQTYPNAASESLARRAQATADDPEFQKMKAQFTADFDFKAPGAMKLHNLIAKLRKWIKILETKTKLLPKSFLIEEKCRFLSYFSQQTAEIEIPGEFLLPRPNNYYVRISRFMPRVSIVQKHNAAARRLLIKGHNGKIYPYLVMNFACLSDARREERVLQLLRMLNSYLGKQKETLRRFLTFTVPRVVSLSPHMRIVEDRVSSISLLDIYKQCCAERSIEHDAPLTRFYERLAAVQARGSQASHQILRDILKDVQNIMVSRGLLRDWAQRTYPSATDYWTFRKQFTLQLSLIGFVEYVLHLTRLNPDMMYIHQDSGLMNVSYFLFNVDDSSGDLDANRPVPFRLTPNISEFITAIGICGPMTASMIATARCLVQPSFKVLDLLRAILRDEMIAWNKKHQDDSKPNIAPQEMDGALLIQMVTKAVSAITARLQSLASFEGVDSKVSTLVTAANSHDNLCRMDPAWHPWL